MAIDCPAIVKACAVAWKTADWELGRVRDRNIEGRARLGAEQELAWSWV